MNNHNHNGETDEVDEQTHKHTHKRPEKVEIRLAVRECPNGHKAVSLGGSGESCLVCHEPYGEIIDGEAKTVEIGVDEAEYIRSEYPDEVL